MTLVNHVGLTVSDLERSIEFYRDVVGFELLKRTEPLGKEWFRTLTDNHGSLIKSAMVGMGGFRLQLVTYLEGGSPAVPVTHAAPASPHFCVNITDADARRDALVAAGRYRVGEIVDIEPMGHRSFYVFDPDGVPVELLEPRGVDRWP